MDKIFVWGFKISFSLGGLEFRELGGFYFWRKPNGAKAFKWILRRLCRLIMTGLGVDSRFACEIL